MKYSKVKGKTDLIRDHETNAIINVNMSEYNRYMNAKSLKDNQVNQLSTMKCELDHIKHDIDNIKVMLKTISEKLS